MYFICQNSLAYFARRISEKYTRSLGQHQRIIFSQSIGKHFIISTMLNRQRLLTWIPRVGFGLLLLVFGELVAWQYASQYDAFDWMALIGLYFAMGAILLDVIVRWHIQDWLGLLLIAGIFGLTESTLISARLFDNLPISLVFYGTGLETIMFLLAFGAFLYLSTARSASAWLVGLAAVVGLGWGIWVRAYPELEHVQQSVPSLDTALPAVVIALLGNLLVLFVVPHPKRCRIKIGC